jgi:hypothetical protein
MNRGRSGLELTSLYSPPARQPTAFVPLRSRRRAARRPEAVPLDQPRLVREPAGFSPARTGRLRAMTSRPVIGRGAWEASLPEGGKCRTLAAGQASSIVHPFRHHLGRLAGLLRSSEEFQTPKGVPDTQEFQTPIRQGVPRSSRHPGVPEEFQTPRSSRHPYAREKCTHARRTRP